MKSTNNIIIGIFFVVLGVLFLLRNFNLFHFSIGDVFRLWPIALIYIGVGMLPVTIQTKAYLETAVIVLFFIALITLPYLSENTRRHHEIEYEYDDDDSSVLHQNLDVKYVDVFVAKSMLI